MTDHASRFVLDIQRFVEGAIKAAGGEVRLANLF